MRDDTIVEEMWAKCGRGREFAARHGNDIRRLSEVLVTFETPRLSLIINTFGRAGICI